MKRVLSIFCDESGDSGLQSKNRCDFYIVTLLFHEQKIIISEKLARFEKKPVFHSSPLIRREGEFKNLDLKERQRLLNDVLVLTSILPIKQK